MSISINITYDLSVTLSPFASQIELAVSQAVTFYQSEFTNAVGFTIDVGFGEVKNQPIPSGDAAQSHSEGSFVGYATLEAKLSTHSVKFGGFTTSLGSVLPAPGAVPAGAQFWIPYAEQKALGLLTPANSGEIDGYIGLSSALSWDWQQSQIVSGTFNNDAVGAIEHELSELMGRIGYLGDASEFTPPVANDYGPIDLYRFAANGTHQFSDGIGFFSLDGSNLQTQFNDPAITPGDAADWDPTISGDSFGDNYPGVGDVVTATDLEVMQALGWTQSSSPDLTASAVATNFGIVQQGSTVTVSYQLNNIGWAAVGSSQAYVYLYTSPPAINDTGVLLAVVSQPNLSSDASTAMNIQALIPGSVAPGTYYIGVKVNPNFTTPESDYADNYSSDVVRLTVTAEPAPFVSAVTHSVIGSFAGTYLQSGDILEFDVSSNDSLFVTGAPQLRLSNGAVATFASGSGTSTLKFFYFVLPGQHGASLSIASQGANTGLDLNGGTILNAAGAALTGNFADTTSFSVNATPIDDLNNDSKSDILWRQVGGGLADWVMNGGVVSSGATVTAGGQPVAPDASWSVAAITDLSGDGHADVLWRNSGGQLALWIMNGSVVASSSSLTSGGVVVTPDASWSLTGVGSLDGSSKNILWRNSSGELAEWKMGSVAVAQVNPQAGPGTIIGSADLTSGGTAIKLDSSWSMAGIGDFNGDGKSDLIWRSAAGELVDWQMDGSTIAASGDLKTGGVAARPDTTWSVAGVGDFNADGNADLLWRSTSGSLVEWLMSGSNIIGSAAITSGGVPVSPDASWHIVEVGDFNGDARSDILWRNDSGAMAEWTLNGAAIVGSTTPTSGGAAVSPDASWQIQAKPTDFA